MTRNGSFEALYMKGVSLLRHSSYEIGGEAAYFTLPKSVDELQMVLNESRERELEHTIFGYGSNILFPDTPGASRVFTSLKRLTSSQIVTNHGEAKLFLSAGVPLAFLALVGVLCNYRRMLFTHLLPGCIGSGVYINAKCYEDQMSEILNRVYYIDPTSNTQLIQSISVEECDFGYKTSIFQKRPWIIVGADFIVPNLNQQQSRLLDEVLLSMQKEVDTITKLSGFYSYFKQELAWVCRELQIDIPEQLTSIDNDRNKKQHFSFPSCGSVFKNNYSIGKPMGVLIDELQLKGKEYGGAMISPYHGNFIINYNHAKAEDVRYLIQFVQEAVHNKYGFIPEPEVVIV